MNTVICPNCLGRCKPISIGWKCEDCGGGIDVRGQFREHRDEPFMPPMTNADHIRGMSDEELSRHCNGCPPGKDYMTCEFVGACDACWLEWLQQPYKEGET